MLAGDAVRGRGGDPRVPRSFPARRGRIRVPAPLGVAEGAVRASPGRGSNLGAEARVRGRRRVRVTCLSPASPGGFIWAQGGDSTRCGSGSDGFDLGEASEPPAPRVGERELLRSHVFTLRNV